MKMIAARILLILFSLAVAMATGEVGLRIIGFQQPRILPAEVRTQYTKGPYAEFLYRGYLPGTFEDFENPVKLNQYGFHDRDYTTNRPSPTTYRVMVLGDSYVAGLSIPLAQIFHKRIEEQMKTRDPLKRGSYEVIAFGQGHRAQKAELEWLKEYGPKYHPDVILLMFFCGNDVMENDPDLFEGAHQFGDRYMKELLPRKEAFFQRWMLLPRSRMNGAIAEMATTYYAAHMYRYVHDLKKEDFISPELGVYQKPLAPEWQKAFAMTGELLRDLRSECKRQDAPLLIGCLEGPQAVGDVGENILWSDDPAIDFNQPSAWVKGWCATNQIPFCDLEESLVQAGRTKVFWRHDGHLNPYGNEVVALPLYRFILEHAQAQPEG